MIAVLLEAVFLVKAAAILPFSLCEDRQQLSRAIWSRDFGPDFLRKLLRNAKLNPNTLRGDASKFE